MINNLRLFVVAFVFFFAISTRGTHCLACGFLWSQIYDSFYIKNPKCFSCLDCQVSLLTGSQFFKFQFDMLICICEKTASSEKFRLEIDLNFLENMNVLIVDRPPCYPSPIEQHETLLGVSMSNIRQLLHKKSQMFLLP